VQLFACAACVLPTASYVLAGFGWQPSAIGVGTALAGVAATVAAPAWGWLDDRVGWAPRVALTACALAATATAVTLGHVAHAVSWLGLAAFGAAEGPLDAFLTTRILGSVRHAARLGSIRAFGSVGWVAGLMIAAAVLTAWPQHAQWVLYAAALLAITAPSSWGRRSRVGPPEPAGRAPHRAHRAPGSLPLRSVLGVLVFTFPTSLVMSSVVQFTAGWARQMLGAGPFLALAPIAVSAALELRLFPVVDRLAERLPARVLAVLAGPPLAVATAVLGLAPSTVTVLLVQPLVAASFCLWFLGQSRMLAEAVPTGQQGAGQTLGAALSSGASSLLAGVVGGHVADALGYGGLFASLAGVSFAGATLGLALTLSSRRRDVIASARVIR
jgi:hypothetical protein